ncbi:MBL fold metallo-hydrolase [Methanopyrus sp.]
MNRWTDNTTMFFAGTGGGRFAMITQKRRTGGFRLEFPDFHLHVDPGPGCLLSTRLSRRPTTAVDAVFVSHSHPDHYAEAEVLVEAMTRGGTKRRGIFVGSVSAVEGCSDDSGDYGPVLSAYHRSLPEEVVALEPGDEVDLPVGTLEAVPTAHGDPTGIGFRLETEDDSIYYTGDTELREDLFEVIEDVTVAIVNVVRPGSDRIRGHLCTRDVIELVSEAPELRKVFITHFGMKMLRVGPGREARRIEHETGVETVAARDGRAYDL